MNGAKATAIGRGLARLLLVVVVVLAGVLPVVLLSALPVRHRGAKLGAWLTLYVARALTRLFGVRVTCRSPQLLAQHHGLVFANHTSYLDIIALLDIAPTRFLAAREVQRLPVIGWYAAALEAVFVERRDRRSRRAARHSVAAALRSDPYPPIAIFPEGRLGPGHRLNPFRFGAFELAIQNGVAFLPCAIRYNRPDVVTWHGGTRNESLPAAVWRLAAHDGLITAELIPLLPMRPAPGDDAALLAAVTQRSIEQALDFPSAPLTLAEVDQAAWERA